MNRVKNDPPRRSFRHSAHPKERNGAAFLMLVIVIVVVIAGATRAIVRNEIHAQRSTRGWMRGQAMEAAIAEARRSGAPGETWSLPIEPENDEYVEVLRDERLGEVRARWIRRGEVIDEMVRKDETTDLEMTE
jgi:hypothetical protein